MLHILHTSLYNGWFVAGAHGEDFEDTARCPKQLLVVVVLHDVNQTLRTSVGENDQLFAQRHSVRKNCFINCSEPL